VRERASREASKQVMMDQDDDDDRGVDASVGVRDEAMVVDVG